MWAPSILNIWPLRPLGSPGGDGEAAAGPGHPDQLVGGDADGEGRTSRRRSRWCGRRSPRRKEGFRHRPRRTRPRRPPPRSGRGRPRSRLGTKSNPVTRAPLAAPPSARVAAAGGDVEVVVRPRRRRSPRRPGRRRSWMIGAKPGQSPADQIAFCLSRNSSSRILHCLSFFRLRSSVDRPYLLVAGAASLWPAAGQRCGRKWWCLRRSPLAGSRSRKAQARPPSRTTPASTRKTAEYAEAPGEFRVTPRGTEDDTEHHRPGRGADQRTVRTSALASPRSSAATALLRPVNSEVNIGESETLSTANAGSS